MSYDKAHILSYQHISSYSTISNNLVDSNLVLPPLVYCSAVSLLFSFLKAPLRGLNSPVFPLLLQNHLEVAHLEKSLIIRQGTENFLYLGHLDYQCTLCFSCGE